MVYRGMTLGSFRILLLDRYGSQQHVAVLATIAVMLDAGTQEFKSVATGGRNSTGLIQDEPAQCPQRERTDDKQAPNGSTGAKKQSESFVWT
jgi:hypothetical protein